MNRSPYVAEASAALPMTAMTAMTSNIEAEQAVLGIVLYENEALHACAGLKARDFYEPFHQRLFSIMEEQIRRGQLAAPNMLAGKLAADLAFQELGGTHYLADLVDLAPPCSTVAHYAREVTDQAIRRGLITETGEIALLAANDHDRTASELIADAERRLSAICDAGPASQHLVTGAEAIDRAVAHAEKYGQAPAFPTGLYDLDQMLGGAQPGELTILAGRPGSGKTLAGQGIARFLASTGLGTAYFSMEMSAHALGLRLACDVAFQRGGFDRPWGGPTMAAVSTGNASREHLHAIADARQLVSEWPLLLDCRPGLTLSQIEQTARRQYREWDRRGVKPGPIFVDHLGLVRPEKDRQGSRHAEVADVSRGLAELAKRLDVPIIALCQLNRGVESREDKRPMLADLRQAGELEEDARVVLMLHRPAYYFRPPEQGETFEQEAERLSKEDRDRNLLRIIVAKNSNGPTGEVETFVDVTRSAVRNREASR